MPRHSFQGLTNQLGSCGASTMKALKGWKTVRKIAVVMIPDRRACGQRSELRIMEPLRRRGQCASAGVVGNDELHVYRAKAVVQYE